MASVFTPSFFVFDQSTFYVANCYIIILFLQTFHNFYCNMCLIRKDLIRRFIRE